MKRRLVIVIATLVANAVGLLAANLLLDKVSVGLSGFLTAVVLFTVVSVIAEPLISKVADDKAPAVVGVASLLATLLSLVITSILSKSLDIGGSVTWLLAAVVVWLVSAILRFIIVKGATGEATEKG